jgi:hypothetical protein
MRFSDIDHQKGNAVAILFKEPVEGRNLLPEGRSGIAAKDQHHGTLPVQCGELNVSALVLCHKGKIRRGITYV